MRTDEDICRDIEAELQWNPQIDDTKIGVSVIDGIVTLTGELGCVAALLAAEEVTKRVNGVSAIASAITVELPSSGTGNDAVIADAAVHALRQHAATALADITPVVQNGWVELSGHVTWSFQKASAEHSVRKLPGVRGIQNDLVVTSSL